MERALSEHDAPADAIAAVLRDLVDQRAWPFLVWVSCHTIGMLDKDAIQGAPGTSHHVELCDQRLHPPIATGEGEAPLRWCPVLAPWPALCYADNADNIAN